MTDDDRCPYCDADLRAGVPGPPRPGSKATLVVILAIVAAFWVLASRPPASAGQVGAARRLEKGDVFVVEDGRGRWLAVGLDKGVAYGLLFGVGAPVEGVEGGLLVRQPGEDKAAPRRIQPGVWGWRVTKTTSCDYACIAQAPLETIHQAARQGAPSEVNIPALWERASGAPAGELFGR